MNQSLGSGDTHSIKLADLNGDGALDLVAGNASAQGNTVWLNDGTGNFVTTGQSLGNGETWSIALGDLNRDGYADIASGNDGQPECRSEGRDHFDVEPRLCPSSRPWFVCLARCCYRHPLRYATPPHDRRRATPRNYLVDRASDYHSGLKSETLRCQPR